MKIPKIIHQTWKNRDIPVEWQAFAESWRNFHPDWEYRLWTDDDAYAFVEKVYPDFLPLYAAYPYNIERVDVVRYLILEHLGGVYADLDIECLRPIDELLAEHTCVLASQPPKHAQWHHETSLVCNSFMASISDHPFWQMVREQLAQTDPRMQTDLSVVHRTGPNMLQRVQEKCLAECQEEGWEDEKDKMPYELDSHITSPIIITRLAHEYYLKKGELPDWYKAKLIANGTYAIHYFSNSWHPPTQGELFNPEPDQILGFIFYQGVKSFGYELENLGRNIPEVGQTALHDKRVVAFDTDGYTKSYVFPSWQWTKRISADENEGLYIKQGIGVQLRLSILHVYIFGERWLSPTMINKATLS